MSKNLPTGFTLTSLNGIQCTIVPRSLTAIAGDTFQASTSSSSSSSTSVSSSSTTTKDQNQPAVVAATQVSAQPDTTKETPTETPSSITTSTSTTPVSSNSEVTSTGTPSVSTLIAPTQVTSDPVITPTAVPPAAAAAVTTQSSLSQDPAPAPPAVTASNVTTPTSSSSSPPPPPQAQSEVSPSTTPIVAPSNSGGGSALGVIGASTSSATVSHTGAATHDASDTTSHTGSSSTNTGTVVGGVIGAFAIVGLIGLVLWFCRRRRRSREASLTPLGNGVKSEYEDDAQPKGFNEKFSDGPMMGMKGAALGAAAALAGIGALLRSKVVRARSTSSNVNLNRGNSQFLEGQIPTHSRNNSSLSRHGTDYTVRDRITNRLEGLRDVIVARLPREKSGHSIDPFARGMSEKTTVKNPPDFSALLAMDERSYAQGDRCRTSSSPPLLGSLGLDFSAMDDPFRDPIAAASYKRETNNPFADPVALHRPSMQKENTYVRDIRRSRGQSVDATAKSPLMQHRSRGLSIYNIAGAPPVPASRYPSTITPTRDSYRDTVYSSYSGVTNGRKGKGRSDPFDLERPELWPKVQTPPEPMPHMRNISVTSPTIRNTSIPEEAAPTPRPRVVSVDADRNSGGSYTSRYSGQSETEVLNGECQGPGPDLGPGNGYLGVSNRLSELQRNGSLVSQLSKLSDVSEASEISAVSGKTVGKAM